MKILPLAIDTRREVIRNKVLYPTTLFSCILTGISPALGVVSIGDTIEFAKGLSLCSIFIFGATRTAASYRCGVALG
jgi:hypothetical protein